MSNVKIIESFFGAVAENKKENIMAFFDDESVFNNIPLGPVKGREAIWEILKITAETSAEVLFEVINIAETENGVVLTERIDYFDLKQSMDQMPSDADLSFLN